MNAMAEHMAASDEVALLRRRLTADTARKLTTSTWATGSDARVAAGSG
jgi:hypothetical protein